MTREQMIAKHGSAEAVIEYMRQIGRKGGSAVTEATKRRGFGGNTELAKRAGSIGGKKSKKSS